MRCKNCGSDETHVDPGTGTRVCVKCGGVAEEAGIVSEVDFQNLKVAGKFIEKDKNPYYSSSKPASFYQNRGSTAKRSTNSASPKL